jgi:sporulation protein YlmC with PRC-barrel domain
MRSKFLVGGACAVLLLSTAAQAQNAPSAPRAVPAPIAPMNHAGEWRSSKLIGLSVYNMQNEKVGDINEILIQPSGKVTGFVVGVGGFLGMGEHDVLLTLEQIKFVTERVRTSSAPVTPNTTGSGTTPAPARPARAANERWYPDHAVVNGTKDQLKAMPQFKYSN